MEFKNFRVWFINSQSSISKQLVIHLEYISSIDVLRRRSGDEYGWDFTGKLDLEPEVKKYINNTFKENPDLDEDSFPYDEMYDYFTEFWNHEDESYDDISQEVMDYISSKVS